MNCINDFRAFSAATCFAIFFDLHIGLSTENRHELQVKTRDNLTVSRDMRWSSVTRVTCVTPFSAVKRSSVLGESLAKLQLGDRNSL